MIKSISRHNIGAKIISLIIIACFLGQELSFAMGPVHHEAKSTTEDLSVPSRFVMLGAGTSELSEEFKKNAGIIYISQLIGTVLTSHGSIVSAKGLKKVIKRHLSQFEFEGIEWQSLYKDGNTFCLPYLDKTDGLKRTLRYYLESDLPQEAAGKKAIPLGRGDARVIREDMYDYVKTQEEGNIVKLLLPGKRTEEKEDSSSAQLLHETFVVDVRTNQKVPCVIKKDKSGGHIVLEVKGEIEGKCGYSMEAVGEKSVLKIGRLEIAQANRHATREDRRLKYVGTRLFQAIAILSHQNKNSGGINPYCFEHDYDTSNFYDSFTKYGLKATGLRKKLAGYFYEWRLNPEDTGQFILAVDKELRKKAIEHSDAPEIDLPLSPQFIKNLFFTKESIEDESEVKKRIKLFERSLEEANIPAPLRIGKVRIPESLSHKECVEFNAGRITITCFPVEQHADEKDGILMPVTFNEYVFLISRGEIPIGHGVIASFDEAPDTAWFRYAIHGGSDSRVDYRGHQYGKEALALIMAICTNEKRNLFMNQINSFVIYLKRWERKTWPRSEGIKIAEILIRKAGYKRKKSGNNILWRYSMLPEEKGALAIYWEKAKTSAVKFIKELKEPAIGEVETSPQKIEQGNDLVIFKTLTKRERQIILETTRFYGEHGINNQRPTSGGIYAPTETQKVKEDLYLLCKQFGLNRGKKFYDLGYGDGRTAVMMSALGLDVYGDELDPKIADKAEELLGKTAENPVLNRAIDRNRLHLSQGNFFDRDLSQMDALYFYYTYPIPDWVMGDMDMAQEVFGKRVKMKLLNKETGMKPGAKFIVYCPPGQYWLDDAEEFTVKRCGYFKIYELKPQEASKEAKTPDERPNKLWGPGGGAADQPLDTHVPGLPEDIQHFDCSREEVTSQKEIRDLLSEENYAKEMDRADFKKDFGRVIMPESLNTERAWYFYCRVTNTDIMAFLNHTWIAKSGGMDPTHILTQLNPKLFFVRLKWLFYWPSAPFSVLIVTAFLYRCFTCFKERAIRNIDFVFILSFITFLRINLVNRVLR